ncbi:MAG: ROK family protein [Chthoniobacterales bacterium]
MKKILVVDVGGSNVKLMISTKEKRRKFPSGPTLSPRAAVAQIKKATSDWSFDAVAIGFPAPVRDGKIASDPKNLGKGWVGFDFAKALGKPVRLINDAALQALGSYHGGGRMLFLGLGTGLGSALVWKDHVLPLEFGDLPYQDEYIIEDWLGDEGLAQIGRKNWLRETRYAIKHLKLAVIADYVVLGGGNARLIETPPAGIELGHNRNVYPGGVRLWENDPKTRRPRWRIL